MKYTVSSDSPDIQWGLTGEERIVQNVLNILRTKKHEVPFMRDFGVDPDNFDEDIDFIRANIMQDVTNEIKAYESRVEVLGVTLSGVDENNNLIITVEMGV